MKLTKRYLIFLVKSPLTHSKSEINKAIKRGLKRTFGEKYLALSGVELVEYDEKKNIGVLRCYHNYLELVRASLALVTNIGGSPAALYVLKATGTRKKAIRIISSYPLQ